MMSSSTFTETNWDNYILSACHGIVICSFLIHALVSTTKSSFICMLCSKFYQQAFLLSLENVRPELLRQINPQLYRISEPNTNSDFAAEALIFFIFFLMQRSLMDLVFLRCFQELPPLKEQRIQCVTKYKVAI